MTTKTEQQTLEWPTAPLSGMIPWPGLNPRRVFNQEEIDELAESIRQDGLLQPLGVKPNDDGPDWIYAGERRYRACQNGVLDDVPVMYRDIDEAAARRLALTENIQREQLSAIEEAWGIRDYMTASEKKQGTVAEELGKTPGWVSNRLRLLKLSEPLQEMLATHDVVTATQVRDLILPFSSIPTEPWEAINDGLVKALPKLAAKLGRGLVDEELRMQVSKLALPLSGWTDLRSRDWSTDDARYAEYRYLPLDEKTVKKAPKGSVVKYIYGSYPTASKTARCFDLDWWEKAMAKAEKTRQKDRAADNGANGVGMASSDPEPLDWTPDLGPIPADVDVPRNRLRVVYTINAHHAPHWYHQHARVKSDNDELLNADTTMIPAEKLVLRAAAVAEGRPAQVLCTDPEVYGAACESLETKLDELIASKKAQVVGRQIEESKRIRLMDALPTLVSLGYDIEGDPPALEEAIQDMELTGFPEEWEDDLPDDAEPTPWHHRVARWFVELRKVDREAVLKLAVVKALGDATEHDPKGDARRSIFGIMKAELEGKVEFALPAPAPATPDPEDEPEGDEGDE